MKITIKLVFGTTQTLIAFSNMVLAIFLKINLFGIQGALNISTANVNFYLLVLLGLGIVFSFGGLFLVYEWWEKR